MQADVNQPTIAADEVGLHFLRGGNHIIVVWGEIAHVCALRASYADGTPFIEVFIDHVSGVDFRFTSLDAGYEQTIGEMERRLMGFGRAALEAVRSFEDEGETIPVVWKRDEVVQPFHLRASVVDSRDPTPGERAQMQAARQASIEACEKVLGRRLEPEEIACVRTAFENGRIVGSIASPLCQLLVERQSGE